MVKKIKKRKVQVLDYEFELLGNEKIIPSYLIDWADKRDRIELILHIYKVDFNPLFFPYIDTIPISDKLPRDIYIGWTNYEGYLKADKEIEKINKDITIAL